MKLIKAIMAVCFCAALITTEAKAEDYDTWEDVVSSNKAVNIYVKKVVNSSENKKVSEERSTETVKKVFSTRISPKFNIVSSEKEADIIFDGEVTDYVWMEKAPITDIYGAGALAVDIATRGGKNYARKIIQYRIYDVKSGKQLLEGETLVTLKRKGMPEEKSYEMMYSRGQKMLSKDLFKKDKKRTLMP